MSYAVLTFQKILTLQNAIKGSTTIAYIYKYKKCGLHPTYQGYLLEISTVVLEHITRDYSTIFLLYNTRVLKSKKIIE